MDNLVKALNLSGAPNTPNCQNTINSLVREIDRMGIKAVPMGQQCPPGTSKPGGGGPSGGYEGCFPSNIDQNTFVNKLQPAVMEIQNLCYPSTNFNKEEEAKRVSYPTPAPPKGAYQSTEEVRRVSYFTSNRPAAFAPEPYDRWG
jgi:hypothetical protein